MASNPRWDCFSYLCHCQCSELGWRYKNTYNKSSAIPGDPRMLAVSQLKLVLWLHREFEFWVRYFNSYILEVSTTCFWRLFHWLVYQYLALCCLLFSLFWSEDSEYPMKRTKWCNETLLKYSHLNKLLNGLECLKFFFFRDVIYPNEGQLVSKFQRQ